MFDIGNIIGAICGFGYMYLIYKEDYDTNRQRFYIKILAVLGAFVAAIVTGFPMFASLAGIFLVSILAQKNPS